MMKRPTFTGRLIFCVVLVLVCLSIGALWTFGAWSLFHYGDQIKWSDFGEFVIAPLTNTGLSIGVGLVTTVFFWNVFNIEDKPSLLRGAFCGGIVAVVTSLVASVVTVMNRPTYPVVSSYDPELSDLIGYAILYAKANLTFGVPLAVLAGGIIGFIMRKRTEKP